MKTKQNSYDQLKKGKRIWLQTGLKLTHSDYVGFNPRGIFSGIGLDSQSKECFFTNLVFINAMRGLKIGILDRKLESYFKSSLLIKYWEFINNTLTNQNNLKSENLIQIPTSEEIHTNNMSKGGRGGRCSSARSLPESRRPAWWRAAATPGRRRSPSGGRSRSPRGC